jgi:hypothetical protein
MCINKGDSEGGQRPDAAFHAAEVIELNLTSLSPFCGLRQVKKVVRYPVLIELY